MDFIKKHYEKILLSAVLLGLVGALVFLPVIISNDQQKAKAVTEGIISRKPKPLTNLDLTLQSNVITRLESPYLLDFDTTNKLFNSVEWQRTVDGRLIKATGATPAAALVTAIRPLCLVLTLDRVETNELGVRYVIGVERQAAASLAAAHRQTRYASVGEKNDVFTIKSVTGAPDNPTAMTLQLTDTGEIITLNRGKSFKRVDDYVADLRYDPEQRKWTNQRVGYHLHFGGVDYTIVDIRANEVVLSAQSNQKKWTLHYTTP